MVVDSVLVRQYDKAYPALLFDVPCKSAIVPWHINHQISQCGSPLHEVRGRAVRFGGVVAQVLVYGWALVLEGVRGDVRTPQGQGQREGEGEGVPSHPGFVLRRSPTETHPQHLSREGRVNACGWTQWGMSAWPHMP